MQLTVPATTETGRKLNSLLEKFSSHPSPLIAAVATPEGRALYNKFRAEEQVFSTHFASQAEVFRANNVPAPADVFKMAKEKPAAYNDARRAGLV